MITHQLPKPLLTAIHEDRCVVFVGAGASMDALDAKGDRLPHWGMLLLELLMLIQESADPDPPEIVAEIQDLYDRGDYMAVSEWIDFRLGDACFRQHLMGRLSTAKSSRVHEILSSKPFRAVLTTNYDRLTEIHWERQDKNPFVVVPQNADNIATATQALQTANGITPIIRAHGALNDPRSLIFFPRSYREIMFRNDPFRTFMSMIFRQFTVLFIGTSFRDPNTQSLLQWIYTVTDGKEAAHYAILDGKGPVFRKYMKANYNIELITYQAPGNNHSELLRLLNTI